MSDRVYRVVALEPMPKSWLSEYGPDGWWEYCEKMGWVGHEPETGAPEHRPIRTLIPRRRFLSLRAAQRRADLMSQFGWPAMVEVGHVTWMVADV